MEDPPSDEVHLQPGMVVGLIDVELDVRLGGRLRLGVELKLDVELGLRLSAELELKNVVFTFGSVAVLFLTEDVYPACSRTLAPFSSGFRVFPALEFE